MGWWAASLLLCAQSAWAQTPSGWAVDRFEPSPAGDRFFSAHSPSYVATGVAVPRFALLGTYALRPLTATLVGPAGRQEVDVVKHDLTTHFQVNVHIAQRVGIDVSLPVTWWQDGLRDPNLPVGAISSPTVGDLRLGVRVRIVGEAERDPASLHIGMSGHLGFFGFSSPAQGATDGAFRARVFVAGAGRIGLFRWSAGLGYHARQGLQAPFVSVSSEVYLNAGVGVSFAREMLFAGVETWVGSDIDAFFQPGGVHAELLAQFRAMLIGQSLQLGLGAGPGLTSSVGTPPFRAMLTIAYTPTFNAPPTAPRESGSDAHATAGTSSTSTSTNTTNSTLVGQNSQTSTQSNNTTTSSNPTSSEQVRFCDVGQTAGCGTGDRDHDGILEPLDVCPETPAGASADPERVGCPDGDEDADGVGDHQDVCKSVAQGNNPDLERKGCPLQDMDGDRIADAADHCPDKPGAPHPDPMLNGCPGLVQLDAGILRILQPIYFATNRDTIQERSNELLMGVVNALQARREIRLMRIEGHTDDQGNGELNVDLSQRRAAAVVRWLSAHGVDPSRLDANGFGSSRPRVAIESSMTRAQLRAARATNRRVEFEIVADGTQTSTPTASTTP